MRRTRCHVPARNLVRRDPAGPRLPSREQATRHADHAHMNRMNNHHTSDSVESAVSIAEPNSHACMRACLCQALIPPALKMGRHAEDRQQPGARSGGEPLASLGAYQKKPTRNTMGDDGFSASELRKRNLRGGSVPDDQLTCVLPVSRSGLGRVSRARQFALRAARAPPHPMLTLVAWSSARMLGPRSASQLRARHAEPDSASPLLIFGGIAVVVLLGAAYFLLS